MSDEPWHGTASGYGYHGCRCARCKEANRSRASRNRTVRYAQRELIDGRLVHPRAPHGPKQSYSNYGCRCVGCSKANAASIRTWRAS